MVTRAGADEVVLGWGRRAQRGRTHRGTPAAERIEPGHGLLLSTCDGTATEVTASAQPSDVLVGYPDAHGPVSDAYCEMMRARLDHHCPTHEDPADCPDGLTAQNDFGAWTSCPRRRHIGPTDQLLPMVRRIVDGPLTGSANAAVLHVRPYASRPSRHGVLQLQVQPERVVELEHQGRGHGGHDRAEEFDANRANLLGLSFGVDS